MEKLKCDPNCCARNLVVLYEGEEFRKYLEHHVSNYRRYRRDVSITLHEVHSMTSSSFDAFEGNTTSKGEGLLGLIDRMSVPDSSSPWDGIIFPAHMIGALEESNKLWDWNDYLLEKQNFQNDKHGAEGNIDWMDIMPFFRSQAQQVDKDSMTGNSSPLLQKSLHDGNNVGNTRKTLYAPLDGDVISLFYRKDLFERHQVEVPRTWDSYRDVAAYFHGKPWGPNNTTLIGSCVAGTGNSSIDSEKRLYAYWASLILSTMTQTRGTSTGFLLDPETTEPILGDAMQETLRILAEQSVLGESDNHTGSNESSSANSSLPSRSWRLDEGNCVMTYSWSNQYITAINEGYNKSNNIGIAPTPGSERVLNRTSGRLQTCTPESCPYGIHFDDVGIINRPSYSAFGGWVGGVSSFSTSLKQRDMADFFSYISNPAQSLSDVLPNERSHFVSPYRYSHTVLSKWVNEGFGEVTASQYIETIKKVNSHNTVSDIRIPPGTAIREIIDQEIDSYLSTLVRYGFDTSGTSDRLEDDAIRSEITANMDRRIREVISLLDAQEQNVKENYQASLGSPKVYEDASMNYIDTNYRDTGWGVAVLICFTSIAAIFWILWNWRKTAMQAFQPILLIQGAMGLFFMGATLFPLGFDDSLFSKEILDVTCMVSPWLYVFGFTVFFSSVYSKIQVCTEVYKHPGKYERMTVRPIESLKLCCRLFLLNGTILGLWTFLDPLKWARIEKTTYGSIYPDGSIESYGTCKSEMFKYPGFAIALFVFNLFCCFVAMLQALRCRLLVLEYREMEWLQLCIIPFFEAWIIGGPVISVLDEQPTAQFIAFLMIIASSSIAAASAIFGPKEWYIRKNNIMANEGKAEMTLTPSPAGVRVLKHPKLESQKHVLTLQKRLVRYGASNTELAIDIRLLQEKFRLLTEEEKLTVVGGMFAKEKLESHNFQIPSTMVEDDEQSVSDLVVPRQDLDISAMTSGDENDTTVESNTNVGLSDLNGDEENQLSGEGQKDTAIYNTTDGLFAGRSVRSIVKLIESAIANPYPISTNSVQHGNLSKKDTSKSTEIIVHPVSGSYVVEVEEKEVSFKAPPSDEFCDEMEDLNHMIEADSIRELQSETKIMAEQFKQNSSFLENISDLRPERNMEDLNQMIESDSILELQSETMFMAEQFKCNSSFLENISDLQPETVSEDLESTVESGKIRELQSETTLVAEQVKSNASFSENVSDHQSRGSGGVDDNLKNGGYHNLDSSNATVTSSTAMTDNGSKGSAIPPDTQIDPSSKNGRECSESVAISSPGESSSGNLLRASEKKLTENAEQYPRQQQAGQPSSDYNSRVKSRGDAKTPPMDQTSPGSSISSSSTSPVRVELDSQFNPSAENAESNALSIDGWKPSGRMGSLLADLSDSTSRSASSYYDAVSVSDSITSLEVVATTPDSEVPASKEIDELLKHHEVDVVKASADKHVDDTDQKSLSRAEKIATTKQKKRELEAMRLSFETSSS